MVCGFLSGCVGVGLGLLVSSPALRLVGLGEGEDVFGEALDESLSGGGVQVAGLAVQVVTFGEVSVTCGGHLHFVVAQGVFVLGLLVFEGDVEELVVDFRFDALNVARLGGGSYRVVDVTLNPIGDIVDAFLHARDDEGLRSLNCNDGVGHGVTPFMCGTRNSVAALSPRYITIITLFHLVTQAKLL